MTAALRVHGPLQQRGRRFDCFGMCWTQSGYYAPEDRSDPQPALVAGRYAAAFLGYLVDRPSLCAALGPAFGADARACDSSLVAQAWSLWGERALDRLDGTFTFILCDTQERVLYAVRSPNGAPPLYFHKGSRHLAIASAYKAIFADADIERSIDERKLADHLANLSAGTARSYYRNITALAPGHLLRADAHGERTLRYRDMRDAPEVRMAGISDYVEAARALLERAVADCTRTRVRPAATLTSGFDSTTVVLELARQMDRDGVAPGETIRTITAVPGAAWDGLSRSGRAGDESGPIKAYIGRHRRIEAHFTGGDGLAPDAFHDQLQLLAEEPLEGAELSHIRVGCSRYARGLGHDVLLVGSGGNRGLSFQHDGIYAQYLLQGRFIALRRALETSRQRSSRFHGFFGQAVLPLLPRRTAGAIQKARGTSLVRGWRHTAALQPDYAQHMRLDERLAEQFERNLVGGYVDHRTAMVHMAQSAIADAGTATMHAVQCLSGVQSRGPLNQRSLTEFCYGLPADQFAAHGQNRLLIKRVMAGRLPPEVLHAPPAGQTSDWHGRMTADMGRYRREIARLSDDDEMTRRFDLPRLRRLIDDWPDRAPSSASDLDGYRMAKFGLIRTLTAARFIQFVEGRN